MVCLVLNHPSMVPCECAFPSNLFEPFQTLNDIRHIQDGCDKLNLRQRDGRSPCNQWSVCFAIQQTLVWSHRIRTALGILNIFRRVSSDATCQLVGRHRSKKGCGLFLHDIGKQPGPTEFVYNLLQDVRLIPALLPRSTGEEGGKN